MFIIALSPLTKAESASPANMNGTRFSDAQRSALPNGIIPLFSFADAIRKAIPQSNTPSAACDRYLFTAPPSVSDLLPVKYLPRYFPAAARIFSFVSVDCIFSCSFLTS